MLLDFVAYGLNAAKKANEVDSILRYTFVKKRFLQFFLSGPYQLKIMKEWVSYKGVVVCGVGRFMGEEVSLSLQKWTLLLLWAHGG